MIFVIIYCLMAGIMTFIMANLKTRLNKLTNNLDEDESCYMPSIICGIFWIFAAPVYFGYLLARLYAIKK